MFTCANDFIDGKNEPLVMRAALRAKVVMAPRACPFRAVSTLHAPGAPPGDFSGGERTQGTERMLDGCGLEGQ